MTPEEFLASVKLQRFYHFTDEANLPSIKEHGLLSLEQLEKRGIAPPKPGGNQWSHDADKRTGLDLYVHLCLFNEHPMEYRAKTEGRIEKSKFLEIDKMVLGIDGACFTAAVANKAGVQTLTIAEANLEMDFEVVCNYRTMDWKNPEVMDRIKAAKKYELLIPNEVPLCFIRGL